jgi:DNA-binding NtrC family response regulator
VKITDVKSFQVRNEIILLLGVDAEAGPVVQRTLEAVGFPVLRAEDRDQADELFRSFGSAIRLLIIDSTILQENSTLEVIAALRKSNPSLKVIVTSKDVTPRERHDIYISGVIELVRKPVDKEQLLQVVNRIVER